MFTKKKNAMLTLSDFNISEFFHCGCVMSVFLTLDAKSKITVKLQI